MQPWRDLNNLELLKLNQTLGQIDDKEKSDLPASDSRPTARRVKSRNTEECIDVHRA
jgi:hypothetical protein